MTIWRKGWQYQPSSTRPRFVLVRQDGAIFTLDGRRACSSRAQREDRQDVRYERPCRGRLACEHLKVCADAICHLNRLLEVGMAEKDETI